MIDVVIPITSRTASNTPLLISCFKKLSVKQDFRINLIYDHGDPSFEYLNQCAKSSTIDVRIYASQSFIDEDAFTKSIASRNDISPNRYKWYWQQSIKLLSFLLPDIQDRILLWDSDTFPLTNYEYFINNIPICEVSKREYHIPYFQTFANLTNTLILPPFSSVVQYSPVLFDELYAMALVFAYGTDEDTSIPRKDCFEPDFQYHYFDRFFRSLIKCSGSQSLFSEYESINLFRLSTGRPFIISKSCRHFRHGGWLPLPKPLVLSLLALLSFSNVSFERYHPVESLRLQLKTLLSKV